MAYRTTPEMARRKDAHRRKLVTTAIQLFGRQGYHATTVPNIVAKSGSSTGSFYFYFRNKEDVFAAALESLGERIAMALNEAIGKAGADPLSQMKAAVEGLMLFLSENPDEARILIVESSGLTTRLEEVRRKIVASHARSVQNALSRLSGRLPEMDTAVVARCWVGAVYEAVYHWLEMPAAERMPAGQLARAVSQFNLRGIGAGKEAL
jgi:TetR/AcrR family transcriptional regulator, fatty acid metabolism regulator protein